MTVGEPLASFDMFDPAHERRRWEVFAHARRNCPVARTDSAGGYERLGVLVVLFLGGLDTTRGAIGSIALQLALHPDLEDRVRDPRWVRQDMDEFIRHASPVGCLARTAMSDAQVGGVRVRAGDRLLIRFDSANRDESRFPKADQLVFDEPRLGHAAFGLGIHRCLGAHLARIQVGVAFEELLRAVTGLRLSVGADEIDWEVGIANGPQRLPLSFEVVR